MGDPIGDLGRALGKYRFSPICRGTTGHDLASRHRGISMKQRFAIVGALLLLVVSLSVLATTATAAPPTTSANLTVPITGTATNALGQAVTFAGQFTLQRFNTLNGGLAAVGQLTGTLTNTVTGAVQNVSQQLTLPITQATGSCQILDRTTWSTGSQPTWTPGPSRPGASQHHRPVGAGQPAREPPLRYR